jgi:uncharacterized tellurite resistance protein B-like protein
MLDQLSPREQRVLLELLIYTAKSDGRVRDIEAEILHQYADLTEVDFDDIDGDLKPETLVPQLESPTSRVIVLQELLRMAHLDGAFNDEERSSIVDIAAMMKVPMQLLQALEEWVVDGLRWVWRGDELLEEAERVVKF